jgi:hypothetical protein
VQKLTSCVWPTGRKLITISRNTPCSTSMARNAHMYRLLHCFTVNMRRVGATKLVLFNPPYSFIGASPKVVVDGLHPITNYFHDNHAPLHLPPLMKESPRSML